MAFDQLGTGLTVDNQYYGGVRTSGTNSVVGTTHLFVPQDGGAIRGESKQLPNGITQTHLEIFDECSTLGELLRTELNEHKDVLTAAYTIGEPAEYTLTVECLTRTADVKSLLLEVIKKIQIELFGLFQDIFTKKGNGNIVQYQQITPLLLRGTIKDIKTSYVNGIRRVILEDLLCLAIRIVQFKESKNILDDEQIAFRLGLIPIDCADIDKLIPQSECDCDEFCSKCSATLQINETHPADSGALHPWMITDLDLKSINHPSIRPISQTEGNHDSLNRINIAPLAPGQEMSLNAIVTMGSGRENAKFKPACRVLFIPRMSVTIHDDVIKELKLTPQETQWFAKECPNEVFTVDEKSQLQVKDADRCTACQCHIIASKTLINAKLSQEEIQKRMEDDTLKPIAECTVHGQDDSKTTFQFAIESVGGMKPVDILMRSIDMLLRKLFRVQEEVKRCKIVLSKTL